jgi:hypothetical protein
MAVTRPVLSPNTTLPPTSSHCALIPAKKKKFGVQLKKTFFKIFSLPYSNCLTCHDQVPFPQKKTYQSLLLCALRDFEDKEDDRWSLGCALKFKNISVIYKYVILTFAKSAK